MSKRLVGVQQSCSHPYTFRKTKTKTSTGTVLSKMVFIRRIKRSQRLDCRTTATSGSLLLFWIVGTALLFVHEDSGKTKNNNRNLLTKHTEPFSIQEITVYLEGWISQLHKHLLAIPRPTDREIMWETFRNLTRDTLLPWDQKYLTNRMPWRRTDGSIFLSIVSYRDEHCPHTLEQAYAQAQYPEQLFVGLVQQNCIMDCRTGKQEDGLTHPAEPDADCYETFCQTQTGKPHCEAGRLRILRMDEPESLGPYMARYLASKLWNGEEWYMQIDAHMTFYKDWDAISLESLQKAPSSKPVSYRLGAACKRSNRSIVTHFQMYLSFIDYEPLSTRPYVRLEEFRSAPGVSNLWTNFYC